MENLFLKALEAINKGKKCAFATVVQAKGSTPRKEGSKMIVYEDGSIFGTIGGGMVEYEAIKMSLVAIRNKKTIFKTYRLDNKEGRPICGGEMSIFIEPLERVFHLVIVGAGHIALPLSFMAKMLRFKVTVIDNRAELANKKRFPHADRIITGIHHKELKKLDIGFESFIVIMTHGHKYDFPVLGVALKKNARYIGLVASQTKVSKFFNTLKKVGFTTKDLKRVYSPVGLNIGAQTPEEIAISIIAEIVTVTNGTEHSYKFRNQMRT